MCLCREADTFLFAFPFFFDLFSDQGLYRSLFGFLNIKPFNDIAVMIQMKLHHELLGVDLIIFLLCSVLSLR